MANKKNKKPTPYDLGLGNPTPDDDPSLFERNKPDPEEELIKQFLPGVLPENEGLVIEASAEDNQDTMSDVDVLDILNIYKNRARTHTSDEVGIRAAVSNEYYLAQPTGLFAAPQIAGRSDYVDTSVMDTIEWLKPQLLDVFCSTEDVVVASARTPAQKKAAEMTTAMVNHVWKVQNNGYTIAETLIHDALMSPAGILKIYWQPDTEPQFEEFRGLTDLQYEAMKLTAETGEFEIFFHRRKPNPDFDPLTAMQHGLAIGNAVALGQQPQLVAPQVEQEGQQGQAPTQGLQIDPTLPAISQHLHDIQVRTALDPKDNKKGKVVIENIPLEEFFLDPQARSLDTTPYVAHARRMTISDLRAEGYDNDVLDRISDTEFDPEMTVTYQARTELQGAFAWTNLNDDADPSMRQVVVIEAYVKMDYDLDNIAEWRKIVTVGDTILLNEACDGNPFIMVSSVFLPHVAFGMSVAEQAQSIQKNVTELMRSIIDNVNLGANARYFADPTKVHMDDLLDSRPGGVVRVKDPNAVGVLQSGSGDLGAATTLIELFSTVRQDRTGVQKLTQGSDADVLNVTATGYLGLSQQAQMRVKKLARDFAERAFKPMAIRIHKLLSEYQNEVMQVRLNGQEIEADPIDARRQYDFDVRVGLGTADKARDIGNLQTLLQYQQTAVAQGSDMVDQYSIHNTLEKLTRAMGFTNVEEFFKKPSSPMPQPKGPTPQQQELQAKMQMEQMQSQNETQRQERQAELDGFKIKAQAANDNHQAELAHQREVTKMKMEHERELEKLYLQAAIQREQIAANAMLRPDQEQAMFNETFASTQQAMGDVLNKINLRASGQYDELLNAIIDSPNSDAP